MIGLPKAGTLKLILDSNDVKFGGRGGEYPSLLHAHKGGFWGWEYSATFDLPAMTAQFFRYKPRKAPSTEKKETRKTAKRKK